jgi:hypothetical protein
MQFYSFLWSLCVSPCDLKSRLGVRWKRRATRLPWRWWRRRYALPLHKRLQFRLVLAVCRRSERRRGSMRPRKRWKWEGLLWPKTWHGSYPRQRRPGNLIAVIGAFVQRRCVLSSTEQELCQTGAERLPLLKSVFLLISAFYLVILSSADRTTGLPARAVSGGCWLVVVPSPWATLS